MKISYKALKKLILIEEDPDTLGEMLTGTGLEVESIEEKTAIVGGLTGLVIGEVLKVEPHPAADRLKLTLVDIGLPDPLSIVCGAANVEEKQKVVVAAVGVTLYPTSGEPFKIKKSKIRGQISEGMLCAEDEIGIGDNHDGIMVLDTSLANGSLAVEYFGIQTDFVYEIGLTPNRADAASHYGVARDIKALTFRPIQLPDTSSFRTGSPNTIQLEVRDSLACMRFCGIEIQNVSVQPSPKWLTEFLDAVGVKSINNIVDVTNYINHFLGQPMHVFDANRIIGRQLIVEKPIRGTKITTLDGIERTFSGQELAINHAEGSMAIAGVMGGLDSGVKNDTKNIFLEMAYFNPVDIRKASGYFGLKTDASFRYERGTDPNMPPYAIKVAAMLIQELAGGEICQTMYDVYPTPIADLEFLVKVKNIYRLIGKEIPKDQMKKILEALDISVQEQDENIWKVVVPPYRVDVTREADIVEEILRIYGFGNVELSSHIKADFLSDFPLNEPEKTRNQLSVNLAARGFNEIMSLSFCMSRHNALTISETENNVEVELLNPLSEDLAVMRQSMLFSGLNAITYNINRKAKDLRLFEFGRTYSKIEKDGSFKEKNVLAVFLTGNKKAESWIEKSNIVSFQDMAQTVRLILEMMHIQISESAETKNKNFDYGLSYGHKNTNWVNFGLINDDLLKEADIRQEVFYAEFDWDALLKQFSAEHQYMEISKFPEVRRDLSLVVDKIVTFERIEKVARATERNLLKDINVFDIYLGDKIPASKKSYSVYFMLQDGKKTLNDEIIDAVMNRLIQSFESELGAIIRT